jgi:hypothetical protein
MSYKIMCNFAGEKTTTNNKNYGTNCNKKSESNLFNFD